MLAELGAERAEPALGSLPGMSFRREVLSGKGRSLNHWGRPIAFLEGSRSDSPKRLPPDVSCAWPRTSSLGTVSPGDVQP